MKPFSAITPLKDGKDIEGVTEVKLSYYPKISHDHLHSITTSQDARNLFRQYWDEATLKLAETFKIMLLNRSNCCIGLATISIGGVSSTIVDPKLIFALALTSLSSAIILCHNHPSGKTKPSEADKALTNKLKNAGEFLDIKVLDHIILTSESYFSFAEEGLL